MKSLISTLLLGTAAALAQTAPPVVLSPQMPHAVKICDEGCTVTMPAGTVYQFGLGANWMPPATATTAGSVYAYYTVLGDPSVGLIKELDVQQTSQPQTITYTVDGSTTPVTVTVPALPSITISTGPWTGPMLTCWQQGVNAKNPDGSAGTPYIVIICNVPK